MFADYREPLVEVASQLLVVLLDHDTMQHTAANGTDNDSSVEVRCTNMCDVHTPCKSSATFALLLCPVLKLPVILGSSS